MESSLTHGVANGQERFPHELPLLEELGLKNLNDIEAAIKRYNIDCDYERTGVIDVATSFHSPSYLDELRDDYPQLRSLGQKVEWLDGAAMQAQVNSPTYTGGLWRKDRAAIVDPARLVWGLKAAAMSLGVRIYEDTKATAHREGRRRRAGHHPARPDSCRQGGPGHQRVQAVAEAHRPLHRPGVRLLHGHRAAVATHSWPRSAGTGRQGLSDISNQFHYYRLTEDNRILWGGYDVIYYWGGKVNAELESRPETWAKLSKHFFDTFPQLEGLKFTHAWGGVIDTCSRFCVFWGQAMQGRVAYSLGYTGLGVASTRFGAEVMLDMLDGKRSQATETEFVKEQAAPVPARAVPVHRHPDDPVVAEPRRQNRQTQPVAEDPRPLRPRLRQLGLRRNLH